jgi:hypothetical protein
MRKRIAVAICSAALPLPPCRPRPVQRPAGTSRPPCGLSFGQLISGAKSTGTATHSNYAGGAHAFGDPAILAAHGCSG